MQLFLMRYFLFLVTFWFSIAGTLLLHAEELPRQIDVFINQFTPEILVQVFKYSLHGTGQENRKTWNTLIRVCHGWTKTANGQYSSFDKLAYEFCNTPCEYWVNADILVNELNKLLEAYSYALAQPLINNLSSIKSLGRYRLSPLLRSIADQKNQLSSALIPILIAAGANYQECGTSQKLFYKAFFSYEMTTETRTLVELLLADIGDVHTPLAWAQTTGNAQAVELLRAAGAEK
jgi:hypothetical protein